MSTIVFFIFIGIAFVVSYFISAKAGNALHKAGNRYAVLWQVLLFLACLAILIVVAFIMIIAVFGLSRGGPPPR